MIIRKIIVAFFLFIFASLAHAKIYTSEANNCLTRPDVNGTLVVHLDSVRSGVFSYTNGCWHMASGDIKFQQFKGILVAISTWVPLQSIDFYEDFDPYPIPPEIKLEEMVNGSIVFNYYKSSREYVCEQKNTVCAELNAFTPRYRLQTKQLHNIHSYYECYITDIDYPGVGDSDCFLNKQYYIEDNLIKECSSRPYHPVCIKNNNGANDGEDDDNDNNGGNNNNNTGNNGGNNNNNNGNNGGNNNNNNGNNGGNNNNNNGNNGGNNNNNNGNNDGDDDDDIVDISVITNELSNINKSLIIISNNTSDVLSSIKNIEQTTNNIENNIVDISKSSDKLVEGQLLLNNRLSDISKTNNSLLSETKKMHSDINKNHNELLSSLNNSNNGGLGDFSDTDENLLNNKFNDSARDYEDKSISYVESTLSKLTNNIPDLTLMFKLPSSFYGGNKGVCKPLSSKLDFDFPFYSKKFTLKFDTSDFCQHYDKDFRGIVDFMFAFMTALAIFRLYHRYNSSH